MSNNLLLLNRFILLALATAASAGSVFADDEPATAERYYKVQAAAVLCEPDNAPRVYLIDYGMAGSRLEILSRGMTYVEDATFYPGPTWLIQL